MSKMTLQQLEARLWCASNMRRSRTSGQNHKTSILSLMLVNRPSGQWDYDADEKTMQLEQRVVGRSLTRSTPRCAPALISTTLDPCRLALERCARGRREHRRGSDPGHVRHRGQFGADRRLSRGQESARLRRPGKAWRAQSASDTVRMWLAGSRGGQAVWHASLAPHIGERLTFDDSKALVAFLAEKTSAPLDAHNGAETSAHTEL
jgi:hypothetical protein